MLEAEIAQAEAEYEAAVDALRAAGDRLTDLRAQQLEAMTPPVPEVGEGELSLFARGDFDEHLAAVDEIEHSSLPKATVRRRPPTLTLSFDSQEDRERLIEELGIEPDRRGSRWSCTWPDDDDGALRLDLEGAA